METGINHFIFISAVIFGIGLLVVLTAKEAVRITIGLTFLFSASILNISAFTGFWNFNPEGQITVLLVTSVCMLNIGAGIVLFIRHYKINNSNLYDKVNTVE